MSKKLKIYFLKGLEWLYNSNYWNLHNKLILEFNESEYIVYTCLIGENEGLNIQPHIKNSKLRHVCLTDDKNLSSNDWEIINVNRIFPKDCYRSQRNFKIRPHIIFPDYK